MRVNRPSGVSNCTGVSRRTFLADCGMGFTGLVLGAMLQRDGVARADALAGWSPPDGSPHFAPKAKSVIWLFMVGGTSHMESFDPKPELNKYAGKTFAETPYKSVLDSPYLKKNVREFVAGNHKVQPYALPDAGRVPEAWRERDRHQRLVAPPGRVHRRRRRRPLDVDHRQRSRRPAPVPHRPPRARGLVPDDRLVGPLRPRLAQRRPPAVRRPGHAARRLLRGQGGHGRTTSAPSTTASSLPPTRRTPSPSRRRGRTSSRRSSGTNSSCWGG